LAEFEVYSNLKPNASTERMVAFPQVTSCGPGPVSLPGAFISRGYWPGALVGELSPNFGDGLRVQAATVWVFEDAGLTATSIPSVNLTP